MSDPIRLLVVDDQTLVRTGFRMILEIEPDLTVVGEAGDGEEALRLADELGPDVVLMDVRMPGMDGIEATRRLLAANGRPCRVVMLTTFDMDEYVYQALEAGASGFLLKDVRPELLVAGIRAVHSGESLLAPTVTRQADPVLPLPAAGLGSRRWPAPRRPDPSRAGGAPAGRTGVDERGDRRRAVRLRDHGQDPRRAGAHEVGAARPGAGGDLRLQRRTGLVNQRAQPGAARSLPAPRRSRGPVGTDIRNSPQNRSSPTSSSARSKKHARW